MIREWLPHLFVGILALFFATSGAAFLVMSDEDQAKVEEQWSDWLAPSEPHRDASETANQTLEVRLPPKPYIVWATVSMAAIGGFYIAAALAGFKHRSEDL